MNHTDCLGKDLEEMLTKFRPELPEISSNFLHRVMFRIPVGDGEKLLPYPQTLQDIWDSNNVKMPYSPESLLYIKNNGNVIRRSRWEIINEVLLKPINNSTQLQKTICLYNPKYSHLWTFKNLHMYFAKASAEEQSEFFNVLLPKIISLALQLPSLVTTSLPLLKQQTAKSVSLSQEQIACLLANAFLCTFPHRNITNNNSEYSNYPSINFSRLFNSVKSGSACCIEKLKCVIHYFRRVCEEMPDGVVTYSRRHVRVECLPKWSDSEKKLPDLHVTSRGSIEEQGYGSLQVDFANKMVGGGVLTTGCVQEEIRFVVCPELILARLFTEELRSTEALLVVGCEQFSAYEGYASSFQWAGDYRDTTPRDTDRRRLCSVVAMDAIHFTDNISNFTLGNIRRELNKAYAGFYNEYFSPEDLPPIATGNWGCGAFGGDLFLKALLQLMAAAETRCSVIYCTYGNIDLRNEIYKLHSLLTEYQITVGQLWHLLVQYYVNHVRSDSSSITKSLYPFLYEAVPKLQLSSI